MSNEDPDTARDVEKADELVAVAEERAVLSFSKLREVNVRRCEDVFHKLSDWTLTDWATAMAGECGEACNKIKQFRRGEVVPRKDIADELADLVIYCDLLAARAGIDLGNAVREKFNEVSEKLGSHYTL